MDIYNCIHWFGVCGLAPPPRYRLQPVGGSGVRPLPHAGEGAGPRGGRALFS